MWYYFGKTIFVNDNSIVYLMSYKDFLLILILNVVYLW